MWTRACSAVGCGSAERGVEVHLVVDGISSQRLTDRQTGLQVTKTEGCSSCVMLRLDTFMFQLCITFHDDTHAAQLDLQCND